MKTTYLLPCQCGEKTQIDASDSGRVIKCHCGASLVVPTLRGLDRLEKVVVEEPPPARAWGGAERGMALGGLITLAGIAMSIYWTVKPIPSPRDIYTPAKMDELKIERFPSILVGPQRDAEDAQGNDDWQPSTPMQTLMLWKLIEFEGLRAPGADKLERYHRALDVAAWWRTLSYVVVAVGVIVLGTSGLVFHIRRSRQRAPRTVSAAAT